MRVARKLTILLSMLILCTDASHATTLPASPHIFAPGVISGPLSDGSITFSADGKTAFFWRSEGGNRASIYESDLASKNWSTPRRVAFSGKWRDLDPAMAPDGSFLLFVSNRPATPDGKRLDAVDKQGKVYPGFGMNIWRVDRHGERWGAPVRLPQSINSSTSTFAPSIAGDGSLYYIGRIGPDGALHLLHSAYRDARYQPPTIVALGNPGDVIRDPAIAPDQSFIVFSTRPAAGKRPLRLAIAFRHQDVWSTPIDLGDGVNDNGYAMGGQLGADHRTLYFYSARADRALPSGSAPWSNGSDNIWAVSLTPWLDAHRAQHN